MNEDRLTRDERMKALVEKKGLDRVPVNPSVGRQAAAVSGVSAREYYLEPEKAFQAQLWARDLYQHDAAPSYGIPDWVGGILVTISNFPPLPGFPCRFW